METEVKAECVSKKETKSYNKEHPIATEIHLQVPYDQNSIYYQMSGGTDICLNTINEVAADMFQLGKLYMIRITPAVDERKD